MKTGQINLDIDIQKLKKHDQDNADDQSEAGAKLKEMNFKPKRIRVAKLFAGHVGVWHQDAASDSPQYRLHMPVDNCGYIIAVHQLHRIKNLGTSDRVHLIMNISDNGWVLQ